MEICAREGIRLSLTSISRPVQDEDGTGRSVTYRDGDLEFDTYAAEVKAEMEARAAPKIPKNFMMDGIGADGTSGPVISQKISAAFDQYYAGVLDEKGIESTIREIVSDFRTSYTNQGFEPGEFMPQLLENVYASARLCSISSVNSQSAAIGRKMAAYYNGNDRNSRDYIYYDAKYYYQSEAMKDTTIEIMEKIAKEYGVSGAEFPREYEDGDIRKGIYGSYNTICNHYSRYQFMIGSMVDETMVPPKGFKFFYKGNDSGTNNYKGIPSSDGTPESAFDGILHIWYGDWSYTGRVPVRQDAARFPVSVNMYGHVSQSRADIPQAIVPMLKNFDFFTVYLSGRYTAAHPRKL